MNFSLHRHTIFLTLAGSQAHGTARDGSDVDLRGVCVAPLPARLSPFTLFEQYEGPLADDLAAAVLPRIRAHPSAARGLDAKAECVVFDIAKFVALCAGANPNALEILFADERDWVLETPAWRRLYGERRQFLTQKVQQAFLGYALAQLKKIKNHRSRLLQPPTAKPRREDRERNPVRADLERRHGYDTKHAMHLIRLMRMGLEALQSGELYVRRADAAELCAIRDGAWSFDELLAAAARLQQEMVEAVATASLPPDIDRARVEALAVALMLEASGSSIGPTGAP